MCYNVPTLVASAFFRNTSSIFTARFLTSFTPSISSTLTDFSNSLYFWKITRNKNWGIDRKNNSKSYNTGCRKTYWAHMVDKPIRTVLNVHLIKQEKNIKIIIFSTTCVFCNILEHYCFTASHSRESGELLNKAYKASHVGWQAACS